MLTVSWKDNSVVLIDQTKLPNKLVYTKCTDYKEVADAIGESLKTVFHYEMGKPTDPIVAEKLLFYFQGFAIAPNSYGGFSYIVT